MFSCLFITVYEGSEKNDHGEVFNLLLSAGTDGMLNIVIELGMSFSEANQGYLESCDKVLSMSQLFYQVQNPTSSPTFFSLLPPEICIQVATGTRDFDIQTENDAREFAESSFQPQ